MMYCVYSGFASSDPDQTQALAADRAHDLVKRDAEALPGKGKQSRGKKKGKKHRGRKMKKQGKKAKNKKRGSITKKRLGKKRPMNGKGKKSKGRKPVKHRKRKEGRQTALPSCFSKIFKYASKLKKARNIQSQANRINSTKQQIMGKKEKKVRTFTIPFTTNIKSNIVIFIQG